MSKFLKGQTGNPNGRKAGVPNKSTIEFKEALNNLLNFAAPKMVGWLERVAETEPQKALDMVSKLAEYVHPKLARSEMTGKDGKDLIPQSVTINLVKPNAAPTS